MHRLTGRALHDHLYVAIRTAPKLVTSGLRSKLPQDGDRATAELARLIAARIDNDSVMVIQADMIQAGCNSRPGKWGVNEPDPTA